MTTGIVYVAVPAAALDRLAKLAGDADVILNHLPALHDPEQTQTLIHVRDVIRHELTWTRPHESCEALRRVADESREVMRVLHYGFREEIDFTPLDAALEAVFGPDYTDPVGDET